MNSILFTFNAFKSFVVIILVLHFYAILSIAQSPDEVKPSTITNLVAISGETSGTIELSWNAAGDDGSAGTAFSYIIRFNTEPISEANWEVSQDIEGEPTPSSAGSVERMIVEGLIPGQRYYFAIMSQDEVFNTSNISNIASTTAQTLKNGSFHVYLPLIVSTYSDISPIIPDTTKILTNTTTQYLSSISSGGSIFTFTQSTDVLDELTTNDIIVGDVSTNAPYGFLRKIVSISRTDGQVILNTESTTLEEAIQTGSLQINHSLKPEEVQTRSELNGVTLINSQRQNTLQDELYISLDNVVFYDEDGDTDTTDDQITANGSIWLESDFKTKIKISNFNLEEVSLDNIFTETADINISAGVEYPFISKEKEIARYYFSPITGMIGFFPVVIIPVLTVNIGVDGSVHVGVSAGVIQQATLTTGLHYSNQHWTPSADFSNEFYFTPPTLSAGLNLKGYAGPQLSLLLYGIMGPYLEVNGYLALDADIFATPWWTLCAGIEALTGFKVDIFGDSIADYEVPVAVGGKICLDAQDQTPPNLPFNPVPAHKSKGQKLDVVLSWQGGSKDNQSVTYDVYFEPNDTTPDILVSDNQSDTIYNPGLLDIDTTYYWQIVAIDERGVTNPGPVWSFDTKPVQTIKFIGQIGDQAQVVFSEGDKVYVGEANTLTIIDASNPISPTVLGKTTAFSRTVEDVYVRGNYVYVANGYNGLRVVDATNPTIPTEISSYAEDFLAPTNGVTISGNYAYVAQDFSGLRIVDITNPENLIEVGAFDPLLFDEACRVAVNNSYAYVANKTMPYFRIIDISNPISPFQTSWFQIPTLGGVDYDVVASGNFIYIANGSGGLRIYDVSDPVYPTEVGNYSMPGYALAVAIGGNYVYVSNGSYGVRIVDVSDPSNPIEIGHYDTSGYAQDISIVDNLIFVADGDGGLVILQYPNSGTMLWR